jgi:hypothetical protein
MVTREGRIANLARGTAMIDALTESLLFWLGRERRGNRRKSGKAPLWGRRNCGARADVSAESGFAAANCDPCCQFEGNSQ